VTPLLPFMKPAYHCSSIWIWVQDFCSFMKQAYIQTMASGGAPPTYK
jgi:hypothetical protein